MRVGFALPQIGPQATKDNVIMVAQVAEQQGYDSLWVLERLLWPLNPRVPYPATPDGSLPVEYQNVLDPIVTLTFAAGVTKRIGLGTSVIDILFHNPLILAKELATLDILSYGRLMCGFGIGWSPEEYEAAGARWRTRGDQADEFLRVVKTVWTQDPVEFKGKYYSIPRSKVGPKPLQKPHPPIYVGGFAPRAIRRAIRLGNGWNPVLAGPLEDLAASIKKLKDDARKARRDPRSVMIVLRTFPRILERPVEKRFPLTGTFEQIREDLLRIREMEVDEVFFDLNFSSEWRSPERLVEGLSLLKKAAG